MFVFRFKQVPILRTKVIAFPQQHSVREADAVEQVWSLLLKHQDRFSGGPESDGASVVVSDLRQETIADMIGVPLHKVIRAVRALQADGRLEVVPQGPGLPNRYRLRPHRSAVGRIAL